MCVCVHALVCQKTTFWSQPSPPAYPWALGTEPGHQALAGTALLPMEHLPGPDGELSSKDVLFNTPAHFCSSEASLADALKRLGVWVCAQ